MPEYNEKDLIKMQNDAMKRVMEMQRRAKESYSAQVPGQSPFEPTFSSQGPATPEETLLQSKPLVHSPIQSPDLVRQLFMLLGTDDPILSAALAYLL